MREREEGDGGDSSVDTQYLTTALIRTTTSIITHHVSCSASLHHNEGVCSCTAWKGQGANGEGGQRLVSDNDRHKMTRIQHCYRCNLKYLLQVKGLLAQSKKSASGKNKITQQRKKEERNLMLIKHHKILIPSLLYHRNSAQKQEEAKAASSSLQ